MKILVQEVRTNVQKLYNALQYLGSSAGQAIRN